MRRSAFVVLVLVGCVSKSDYDALKTQSQTQLEQCQREAAAERGAATMKLAEVQQALRGVEAEAKDLRQLLLQAKGFVEAPVADIAVKETTQTYPVAAALAALLQPHAKHLKKVEDDKGSDEILWTVDEGTVPGAGVVELGRLRRNPAGWNFTLSGTTKVEDYGTVEKLCSGGTTADSIPMYYYRITSGPLKGALLMDAVRGSFTVQSGVYNAEHTWGWKCGSQVLQ